MRFLREYAVGLWRRLFASYKLWGTIVNVLVGFIVAFGLFGLSQYVPAVPVWLSPAFLAVYLVAALFIAQYQMWLELRKQLEALKQDEPDWPIRELFSHLDPKVLDVTEGRPVPWQVVGNRVRDAFALGRVRVWGRVHRDTLARALGEHSVLVEIEPAYWRDGEFTYDFFYDEDATRAQTQIVAPERQHLPIYSDLRVTKARCLLAFDQVITR